MREDGAQRWQMWVEDARERARASDALRAELLDGARHTQSLEQNQQEIIAELNRYAPRPPRWRLPSTLASALHAGCGPPPRTWLTRSTWRGRSAWLCTRVGLEARRPYPPRPMC